MKTLEINIGEEVKLVVLKDGIPHVTAYGTVTKCALDGNTQRREVTITFETEDQPA